MDRNEIARELLDVAEIPTARLSFGTRDGMVRNYARLKFDSLHDLNEELRQVVRYGLTISSTKLVAAGAEFHETPTENTPFVFDAIEPAAVGFALRFISLFGDDLGAFGVAKELQDSFERAMRATNVLSDAAFLDECAMGLMAARVNSFMETPVPLSEVEQKLTNMWVWAYEIAEAGAAERKRRREGK